MSFAIGSAVQGVCAAWSTLNQAAHRIAAGSVGAQHVPPPGTGRDPISGKKTENSGSSMKADLVQELLTVDQAKINAAANMRLISTESDLEQDTLDILA